MKKVENVLTGSDTEAFLMVEATGEIISAEGIIKGTKHNPFNFDPADPFANTSLDNILAEHCIAPAKNLEDYLFGFEKSDKYIQSILPPGVCMSYFPSYVVGEQYLQTSNAKLFGCESDLCVWSRQTNPKPSAENQNLRSAGHHIHTSYDNPEVPVTEQLVKAYDLHLGMLATLLEPDNERRKLYGKAGAFRFKDYGFEYRVLSAYFASSRDLKALVYNNTMAAIDFVNNERMEELEAVGEDVQAAINNNDKTLAKKLVSQFEIALN